ncbi:hypothetical protein RclHR1_13100005 [Rhizophagus clarus]|uniref:PROP1-like PPR domain-containing protein n=1 Tax=Rhizophagus clarus TaxID=94130 RepID=A0A2Z6QB00_9GLOM|nr:hypothetical protein RclHR1_13100005 [Rhizophagus clarus]
MLSTKFFSGIKLKSMFNGPIKATNSTKILFHSVMKKYYWKICRSSLTIFDSQRLCRNEIKLVDTRMYNSGIIYDNFTMANKEESLVVTNNKTRAMVLITNLQELYEYSDGCKPHNINELWNYYMKQKRNFLNKIPTYLHLILLKTLCEKRELEKVLTIIKYLRERENLVKWFNNNLIILEYIVKLNIGEVIEKFNFSDATKGNLPICTITDLIKSLIKKDEIITAEELFRKLIREYNDDIEIYNSMMSGYIKYVKEKKFEKSLYLLEMMQRNKVRPNIKSYNLLLNLFGKVKAQDEAEKMFNDLIEIGIEPDESSYHGIILSCARNNDIKKCFHYFNRMIDKGLNPNIYIYSTLMSACVKSGCAKTAIELYDRMVYTSKIKPNTVILTTLMCAWSQLKKSRNDNLDRIFDDIKKYDVPDLIAYTTLISAKTKQLKLEEAIQVYQQMLLNNIKPNVYTYTTLIDASAKLRNLDTALKLFDDMKKMDILPNQFTYCAIMSAYINNGQLQEAFRTFEEMEQNGLKPDIACINCLLDACNRSGSMTLFFKLYSDLIKKYNLIPDNATISIYIDACTYNHCFNAGKKFYGNLIKNKFPFSIIKFNDQNILAIINFIIKSDSSGEFVKLLNFMKKKSMEPSPFIKLVIYNHLYEFNKIKEIEDVNRVLNGWAVTIPTQKDLYKFKKKYY